MKITEIVSEAIDMSFWKKIDADYNPEAFNYAEKQEERTAMLHPKSGTTPVFTKPVRSKQKPFSNKPPKDGPKSPGYRGNIDAQVKTGHMSKEKGDELVS